MRPLLAALLFACLSIVPARAGSGDAALIATINAKLARWVHPTGQCAGGATERLATFYWQGRRTASGARFDPDGLTAAHRTLPFGTRLSIVNPHNGRAVTVVINDRGPATHAWIDLSRGAARALGLKQSSYVCVSL
ncbi:MAG TPA: septal ring lytic transglycosylase RlpA family protein [Pseudolabrys sp.]|nr:septal ring lytic transglycosylase RlpA family protein [Pseudolabrys sp.]